jgi:hypothetical protein
MGMSDDFELAIAAGSHVVRVGTALFAGVASAVGPILGTGYRDPRPGSAEVDA